MTDGQPRESGIWDLAGDRGPSSNPVRLLPGTGCNSAQPNVRGSWELGLCRQESWLLGRRGGRGAAPASTVREDEQCSKDKDYAFFISPSRGPSRGHVT